MNSLFFPSQFNLFFNIHAQAAVPALDNPELAQKFQVIYPDQLIKFTPLSATAKKIAGLKLYTTILLTLGLAFLSQSFRLSYELYQKNLKIIVLKPLSVGPLWPSEEEFSPIAPAHTPSLNAKTPSATSSLSYESPVADANNSSPVILRPRLASVFGALQKPQLKIQLPPNDSRLTPSPAHFDIEECHHTRPMRRDTPRPHAPFMFDQEAILKAISALAAQQSEDPDVSPEGFPDLREFEPSCLLRQIKPRAESCPSVALAHILEPLEIRGTVSLPASRSASFFLASCIGLPSDISSFKLDDPKIPEKIRNLCQIAFSIKSKLHLFEPLELLQLKRFWASGCLQAFVDEDFEFNTVRINSADIQQLLTQNLESIDKETLYYVGLFLTTKQKTHTKPIAKLIIKLNTLLLLTTQTCLKIDDKTLIDLKNFEAKYQKLVQSGEFKSVKEDFSITENLCELGFEMLKWLKKIQHEESYLLKEVFSDFLDVAIKLKSSLKDELALDLSIYSILEQLSVKWFNT